MLGYADLADFFASAGAVVGGAASLGAFGGYVLAAVRRDIGRLTRWGRKLGWASVSLVKGAECGALHGGAAGVAVVVAKLTSGG